MKCTDEKEVFLIIVNHFTFYLDRYFWFHFFFCFYFYLYFFSSLILGSLLLLLSPKNPHRPPRAMPLSVRTVGQTVLLFKGCS